MGLFSGTRKSGQGEEGSRLWPRYQDVAEETVTDQGPMYPGDALLCSLPTLVLT